MTTQHPPTITRPAWNLTTPQPDTVATRPVRTTNPVHATPLPVLVDRHFASPRPRHCTTHQELTRAPALTR